MDIVALLFYAGVCGLLALFAPQVSGWMPRFSLGAVIGLLAASALPTLRGLIGF